MYFDAFQGTYNMHEKVVEGSKLAMFSGKRLLISINILKKEKVLACLFVDVTLQKSEGPEKNINSVK